MDADPELDSLVRRHASIDTKVVGTVGGFADLLQALVDQQERLGDRVRTLEDEREP